jgi:hypothetical protein
MFISALPDPAGVEEGKMEKGHSIFWFSIIQPLCMNESLSHFLLVAKHFDYLTRGAGHISVTKIPYMAPDPGMGSNQL